MSKPKPLLFFEDKPIFGLDIGRGSLRVMQIDVSGTKPKVIGYGSIDFDDSAIKDGIIEKPEIIAKSLKELFENRLIGDITTNRVAIALPISHAFTRSMSVPSLASNEITEAVQTEIEQYVPANIADLYYSHSMAKQADEASELFLVAMPRKVVDSYLSLIELSGLEAILCETTIGAGAELFARDSQSDIPSVLIDFGTESTDITVYKEGLVVSGTLSSGGEKISQLIMQALDVTAAEAAIIKSKYGLGYSKKQAQITNALKPVLNQLVKEIKRTVRYYEERSGSKEKDATISQVLIMGGGANMPGLADYLTNELRIAVRAFDASSHLDFGHLQPVGERERMSYVTVAGLALTKPSEVFA